MINFDKLKVRQQLSTENIYQLLEDWQADPMYTDFGIICTTICHNDPGEGSRKLYYYENEGLGLFKCYTGCDSTFDIFELTIKVYSIQKHREIDLNEAVRLIAAKFNIAGEYEIDEEESLEDWKLLDNYIKINDIEIKDYHIQLKEYDPIILSRLNYQIKIEPWLNEGITQQAMNDAMIGYFPGADMITIPHFDKDNRLVGLRGRTVAADDAEHFGKYRPLKIGFNWYNHSLGQNLYNLNLSKDNINIMGKAIVFEGEKSCLLYRSYFPNADISVACCGSNISVYHIALLMDVGAKEIIIALDRQFQEIGDKEFKHLTNSLTKLNERYKNDVQLSFIFDKNMITNYKASPIDEGPEKFMKLFKERVYL